MGLLRNGKCNPPVCVPRHPSRSSITHVVFARQGSRRSDFCILYSTRLMLFCRRKRKCPEENVPKMGELAFGSGTLPDRRFIHRSQRRQNADQTAGGSLRRTIGNIHPFQINPKGDPLCIHLFFYLFNYGFISMWYIFNTTLFLIRNSRFACVSIYIFNSIIKYFSF